jgi:hypothetical protein
MDDHPGHLRVRAGLLYALALEVRVDQPAHADWLAERANELQDRATAIEEAAYPPPPTDGPRPSAQLQQQVQPKKNEED